ncbi:ATP-binding protein [Nocardia brasiliensis]|uniref:ATP-binding protein n=1 Tax=Nocardia brasiliensis TaxID=37326 RepID=UPI00245711EC|nr:ATP-binding protein [Nocardia brasiliensis]
MTRARHSPRPHDPQFSRGSASTSAAPDPLDLDFRAEPAQLPVVRNALRDWLSRSAMTADQQMDVVLAVGEACTNAVEHGHRGDGGTIRLRALIEANVLRVTVRDTGCWRPPMDDPASFRGHGVAMMRALMDSVRVCPGDSGTVVEMDVRVRR